MTNLAPPLFGQRQRGALLVLVLWFLALISVAAYSLTGGSRFIAQEARGRLAMAQARHAAEAAIWQTLFGLTQSDDGIEWALNGTPAELQLGDAVVKRSIQDQRGLVDLNGASLGLLELVLGASGQSEQTIAAVAAAIIDWRDTNHQRSGGGGQGAEDSDYLAAGFSAGAKDSPFHLVEELQQVMGVTNSLYDAVEPYLTVHGQTRRLHWAHAPAGLRQLQTLEPGSDQRAANQQAQGLDQQQSAAAAKQLNGAVLKIAVTAQVKGAAYNSSAVVLIDAKAARGFTVLEWREGYATPPADDGAARSTLF